MSKIVEIPIDWAEAYGWKCAFCGGEIDHLHEEPDKEAGTTDDSYTCQDKGGEMCDHAYFVVRWSNTKRDPSNGDALTLCRFIEIDIDERYVNKKEHSKWTE